MCGCLINLPEIMKSDNHKNPGISRGVSRFIGTFQFEKRNKRGRFFKLLHATAHTSNRLHITKNKRNRRAFYRFEV